MARCHFKQYDIDTFDPLTFNPPLIFSVVWHVGLQKLLNRFTEKILNKKSHAGSEVTTEH